MPRPPLPPILLGEVHEAGLALSIRCGPPYCFHMAEIPAGEIALPGQLDMNEVGRRLRCTACGRRGGNSVYPDHRGWVRHLRATGQRERLPWFAVMMPEDG